MNHVVLETESQHLICRHCGSTKRLPIPAPLSDTAAAMTSFSDQHERCPRPEVLPVVKPPRPAPRTTTQALFAWPGLAAWLDDGHRGVSSETIVEVITGIPLLNGDFDVPHDAADFARCSTLLARVPSIRVQLGQLAGISPAWAALVRAWPELEKLHQRGDAVLGERIRRLTTVRECAPSTS